MKKGAEVLASLLAIAVIGLAGSAGAIDIGGAVKSGAKGAGKTVAEKQINDQLAKEHCTFKGKTTEAACNFNKIVAALKAGHTTAEQSGAADFNIRVEAWGPDAATARARADMMRNKLKPLFGGWDYDVNDKVGGNDLTFSVKLN
ncbi:MAG: hypothetical protein HYV03_03305 [Deltaproteobacteria bacterium]|nr:hypothetical protein [Deltaproteobacteria bacterium]